MKQGQKWVRLLGGAGFCGRHVPVEWSSIGPRYATEYRALRGFASRRRHDDATYGRRSALCGASKAFLAASS